MSDELSTIIRGPDDVVAFLRVCEVPTDEPAQIVFGLALSEQDPHAHVVCGAAVRSGPEAERMVDCPQLIGLADELMVCALVMATITAEPPRVLTRREVGSFVTLRRGCADAGVALLDWVVITGHHWWSMREQIIHEAA